MTKPTVSIGIPAFNEGNNIGFLIQELLDQNAQDYELKSIVVASDASTDNTDSVVQSFNNAKVKLIPNEVRQGQAAKQNQIIEACETDILVLLNGDILLDGKDFIGNLVRPIINGADLSCGPLLEIKPTNAIEKILSVGATYRRRVFERFNNGVNFFTCHGSHRALSKNLYKDFRFKGSIAEDAYSYLYCIKNNFKYAYVKDAQAYIKLPTNLKDHVSQSTRFFSASEKLTAYFDTKFINENTKWPVTIFAVEGIKLFFEHPIESVAYALISLYVMFIKLAGLNDKKDAWKMVESSKRLRNI